MSELSDIKAAINKLWDYAVSAVEDRDRDILRLQERIRKMDLTISTLHSEINDLKAALRSDDSEWAPIGTLEKLEAAEARLAQNEAEKSESAEDRLARNEAEKWFREQNS